MGANSVSITVKGYDIKSAFDGVYQRALENSGHQEGYSGDFNSTHFTKDVTSLIKTIGINKIDDYIHENCPKWETWGYCLKEPVTNKNKIKTQVDVTPQKGTRKWITVYEGVERWNNNTVVSDKSQTECIKKVRAYVEKHPNVTINVIISKALVEGNKNCATVTYKKSKEEAPGHYRFIGLAGN